MYRLPLIPIYFDINTFLLIQFYNLRLHLIRVFSLINKVEKNGVPYSFRALYKIVYARARQRTGFFGFRAVFRAGFWIRAENHAARCRALVYTLYNLLNCITNSKIFKKRLIFWGYSKISTHFSWNSLQIFRYI